MNWKVMTLNVVLLIGVVSVGYQWGHLSHEGHSLNTQVRTTQRTNNQASRSLQDRQQRVQADFQRTASHDRDANISSVFSRNQIVDQVSPRITQFFKTYYSFNDSQEYESRSQSLLHRGLITSQLAHDDKVFSNDEIEKGTHYVDIDQLNAKFDSAYSFFPTIDKQPHTIEALTQVKYDASHTGAGSNTGTAMYRVTYDVDQHKITAVQQEAMLFQNSDVLDNLPGNGGLTNY